MVVEIFTDGSCLKNPGPGGWAALVRKEGQEKILKGADADTTNNRMELTAVIKGLTYLGSARQDIQLYTDSQYVQKGITSWIQNWQKNGWRTASKKPVQNKDLWQKLWHAQSLHNVKWIWVKAHAGHKENELVDQTARTEAEKARK